MLSRLCDWGLIARAEYTLLDVDPEMSVASREWIGGWAAARGYRVSKTNAQALSILGDGGVDLTVRTVTGELADVLGEPVGTTPVDLLLANALLDLIDLPSLLPQLLRLVVPAGLCWFSINYDGQTIFEPEQPEDDALLLLYNRSMDERVRYGRPAGHSRTGRRLMSHLLRLGAPILAAGSSDWVVYPDEGGYRADEGYFLHHIVNTIHEGLRGRADVDQDLLADWTLLRQSEIDRAQLIYVAHQMDVLARAPGPDAIPRPV